jgi:hypothetical protein
MALLRCAPKQEMPLLRRVRNTKQEIGDVKLQTVNPKL